MSKEKESIKKKMKKIKWPTLVGGIFLFLFLISSALVIAIYRFEEFFELPKYFDERIFLPAVIIDKKETISIGEINSNLASIRSFYEKQDFSSLGIRIDFSTQEGQKRLKIREKELINKMIEDRMIEKLSHERGIAISDKMLSERFLRELNESGNEKEVRESLRELYGWSLEDFKNKVVKPDLYKDELMKWLEENDGRERKESSKLKADRISVRLKGGEDFETLAKEVSEGNTSDSGGKLGWFREDQISREIKDKVIRLESGKISDVLESGLGYHIVKLNEIKEAEGEKTYNISQIFFPKQSFSLWLSEKIKEVKVSVLIPDYIWNKETGMVEFKDKSMEDFEMKALENFQGDHSYMTF
ncbi:MAG: peptidylprolyl isomerase [Candidatus Moraniibacteriota bacterium]